MANNTTYPLNFIHNSQYKIGSPASLAIKADSTIQPEADLDGREGWLFRQIALGNKFNLYFYGSTAIEKLTLAHLKSYSAVVSVDKYDNPASLPFFIIYTKPTGINDSGAWYHSKIVGRPTGYIAQGEKIQIYLKNPSIHNFGYREVKCIETREGEAKGAEEILYMTIHSDSGALVGSQILISDFMYDTYHAENIHRITKLIS